MDGVKSDLSIQTYCVRAGLLLSSATITFGPLSTSIVFDEMLRKETSTEVKIRLMDASPKIDLGKMDVNEAVSIIKFLANKKRRTKQEIVALKQLERTIDTLYKTYIEEIQDFQKKYGLDTLYQVHCANPDALRIWGYTRKNAELDKEIPLSTVFRYRYEEGLSDTEPDVWALYGDTFDILQQATEVHAFMELPNLNLLNAEQLLAVRKQFGQVREQLGQALPMDENTYGNYRYHTGTWQTDQWDAIISLAKETVERSTELTWASNLSVATATVSMANIPTEALWNGLKDKDLIPETTWEVLQQDMKEGNIPPTIPIMAVINSTKEDLNTAQTAPADMEAPQPTEQGLTKRRTLDID